MMIFVIDNYDSFTYNLVQLLGKLGKKFVVYRNDKIDLEGIKRYKPTHILISPGPGRPQDSGITCLCIEYFYNKVPILGVCLGHQAIGFVFGAKIVRASRIFHGKTSLIFHDGKGLFKNVKNPFMGVRYHSLVIDKDTLSKDFLVCAWSKEDNQIMGIRHKTLPLFGVQFHPESILTEEGEKILRNFLKV